MMKYWKLGKSESGYGVTGLLLENADQDGIVSLVKKENKVTFREECDGYNHMTLPTDQAIELLREAIAWLEA